MAPRLRPGPKPRTKLAGKKVPKPRQMPTISDEAHVGYAVKTLRQLAPHLLAEKPKLTITGASAGSLQVGQRITGLNADDSVVGDRIIRGETHDFVNHPSHYKGANGIECIDCQEAAAANSPLNGFAAHLLATIIGYAFRCGKKDSALVDAQKLQWYANKLVDTLKKEEVMVAR